MKPGICLATASMAAETSSSDMFSTIRLRLSTMSLFVKPASELDRLPRTEAVLEGLDLRRASSEELYLPSRRPAWYLRSNSATVSSESEVRALLDDKELAVPDMRGIVDEGLTTNRLVFSTLKAREPPCMLFLLPRREPDARRSLGERGDFRSCSVIKLPHGLAMPLGFLTGDLLRVLLSKRTAGPSLRLFFLDPVLLARLDEVDLRLDLRSFDVRLLASCSLAMPASRIALATLNTGIASYEVDVRTGRSYRGCKVIVNRWSTALTRRQGRGTTRSSLHDS
jgi:hypothetical protein